MDDESVKQKYLNARTMFIQYLEELKKILEESDEPISGERRKLFMQKFDSIDHNLLHKLDTNSYNYYEDKNHPEVKAAGEKLMGD